MLKKIIFVLCISACSLSVNASKVDSIGNLAFEYMIKSSKTIQSLLIGIEADNKVDCAELLITIDNKKDSFTADTTCTALDDEGEPYGVIVSLSGFKFDDFIAVYSVKLDYAP